MNIYLKLIWAYLKIGIFGFGGGYAMLSLVEKAVVERILPQLLTSSVQTAEL